MTYIASLDPNSTELLSAEAYAEKFEADFPDWRERSADPERFVSETDYFAVAPEQARAADMAAFGGFHNP